MVDIEKARGSEPGGPGHHSALSKRRLLAGTGLVGLAAAAGCGPVGGAGDSPTSSRRPETVVFWSMHSLGTIPRTEEEFSALTTRVRDKLAITLKPERPGNELRDKLITSMAANTPPDAFGVNSGWTVDFYDKGYCLALDKYIARMPEVQDRQFLEGSLYYTKRAGKTYALPWDGPAAYNITYNVNHLREAGVDPSPEAVRKWTWDDLVKVAQKLHQPNAAKPRYAFLSPFGFWNFVTWLYTNGGTFWKDNVEGSEPSFNNERGLQALQYNADLNGTYRVLVPADVRFQPRGWSGLFTGEVSMYHGDFSHWAETAQQRDLVWSVAPFPKGPQGKGPASQAWYHVNAVAAQSKVPDAAFALIAFYSGKEGAPIWIEHTSRPHPRKDAFDNTAWKRVITQVPATAHIPYLASVAGPSPAWNTTEVQRAVNTSLTDAFAGKLAPRDALAESDRQLRAAMQTLKR